MFNNINTQNELVRSSFATVMSSRPELVEDFYTRLFVVAPEVQGFLPRTREEQAIHLESMLQLALSALDMKDAIVGSLHAMGEDYAKRGMQSSQHHMVNEVLMDTLAAQIGDAWTPDVSAAWSAVLNFISSTMIDGAHLASRAVQAKPHSAA
jgi:hemoglobin-like flavoprotein